MKEFKFHLSSNIYISVKVNKNLNLKLDYARRLIILEAKHLLFNMGSFLSNTYPIVIEEIMEDKSETRTTTERNKKH